LPTLIMSQCTMIILAQSIRWLSCCWCTMEQSFCCLENFK
jgi:hypothetical protein